MESDKGGCTVIILLSFNGNIKQYLMEKLLKYFKKNNAWTIK